MPESQRLGDVIGPDGKRYHLDFRGESELMAAVTGPAPRPMNQGGPATMAKVPTVHCEPAQDSEHALAVLRRWLWEQGWLRREPASDAPSHRYRVRLADGREEQVEVTDVSRRDADGVTFRWFDAEWQPDPNNFLGALAQTPREAAAITARVWMPQYRGVAVVDVSVIGDPPPDLR